MKQDKESIPNYQKLNIKQIFINGASSLPDFSISFFT